MKRISHTLVRAAVLLVLTLSVCSCQEKTLVENRSQAEAIRIRAFLSRRGVGATVSKERGGQDKYSVSVKERNFDSADALLKLLDDRHGVLEDSKLQELLEAPSLLPSSRSFEKIKLDHILALELERALLNDPAVASVKAVVRLNFQPDEAEPGVMLVVQERQQNAIDKAKIMEMAQRVVPGIKPEAIGVSVSSDEDKDGPLSTVGVDANDGTVVTVPLAPFLFWKVPESQKRELAMSLIIILVMIGFVGVVAGYFYAYYRGLRSTLADELPPVGGMTALRYERDRRNLPEV